MRSIMTFLLSFVGVAFFGLMLVVGLGIGAPDKNDPRYQAAQHDRHLIASCASAAPRLFVHPSTMQTQWGKDEYVKHVDTEKAAIGIVVTAQNSFGLRIPYRVLCVKDHQRVIPMTAEAM